MGLFAAFWVWMAIRPIDRFDWLLENLMVFASVPYVIWRYRHSPLTSLSYVCLFLFGLLHVVGAHYTYSQVPIGWKIQQALNLDRNHYDRFVHFSFGLLVSIPVLEAQSRIAKLKSWWSYMLPVAVTASFSCLFEIIEWVIALVVDPAAGNAYLGTQGDEWDAQKDMAVAIAGAVIAMTYAWFADSRGRPMHRDRFAMGTRPRG